MYRVIVPKYINKPTMKIVPAWCCLRIRANQRKYKNLLRAERALKKEREGYAKFITYSLLFIGCLSALCLFYYLVYETNIIGNADQVVDVVIETDQLVDIVSDSELPNPTEQ